MVRCMLMATTSSVVSSRSVLKALKSGNGFAVLLSKASLLVRQSTVLGLLACLDTGRKIALERVRKGMCACGMAFVEMYILTNLKEYER